MCNTSAATTAAAPCSSRPALRSIFSPEVPPRVAPSSPVQSPIRRANAWSTSSLARRSTNAVAPKSSMFGGALPHPGEVLVVFAIGISDFSASRGSRTPSSRGSRACSFPFGVRNAVSRPVLQSILGFRAVNHGIPKTKSYARIGTIKTSGSSTGAN
jgi:hypothetical protein